MLKKKLVIFGLLLLSCAVGVLIKDKVLFNEDTYVLTEENLQQENTKSDKVEKTENNVTNKKITVYVSGEVKNPGVVNLKEGDRLDEAVKKLGGTTKKADLNNINLAMKLKDEMHYIIPKIGEKIEQTTDDSKRPNTSVESTTSTSSSQVNINTATIEELDKLPGVGEATANKIINYRDENGNFKSIEEIKNVNGIGDKKFEEMKSLICIN